jgi:hypothetical protein
MKGAGSNNVRFDQGRKYKHPKPIFSIKRLTIIVNIVPPVLDPIANMPNAPARLSKHPATQRNANLRVSDEYGHYQ